MFSFLCVVLFYFIWFEHTVIKYNEFDRHALFSFRCCLPVCLFCTELHLVKCTKPNPTNSNKIIPELNGKQNIRSMHLIIRRSTIISMSFFPTLIVILSPTHTRIKWIATLLEDLIILCFCIGHCIAEFEYDIILYALFWLSLIQSV